MKRYCAYNGLVVLAFLLLWAALVIIEVKVGVFKFLKWVLGATWVTTLNGRYSLHERRVIPEQLPALMGITFGTTTIITSTITIFMGFAFGE